MIGDLQAALHRDGTREQDVFRFQLRQRLPHGRIRSLRASRRPSTPTSTCRWSSPAQACQPPTATPISPKTSISVPRSKNSAERQPPQLLTDTASSHCSTERAPRTGAPPCSSNTTTTPTTRPTPTFRRSSLAPHPAMKRSAPRTLSTWPTATDHTNITTSPAIPTNSTTRSGSRTDEQRILDTTLSNMENCHDATTCWSANTSSNEAWPARSTLGDTFCELRRMLAATPRSRTNIIPAALSSLNDETPPEGEATSHVRLGGIV